MVKIYFETYGCSASFSNSEIMQGILKSKGYEIVGDINEADIVVINTCIVKSPTEVKMWRRLKEFSSLKKKVVVAGCMSEVYSNKIKELYPSYGIIGPRSLDKIGEVVKSVVNKVPKTFIGKKNFVKAGLPRIRKNKIIDIVQISDGCLGNCSYCSVKFAKGRLFSYPIESIIKDVESSLKDGCKEIWITSQDNSAYGVDFSQSKKSKLPQLLRKISEIKGDFFVRVGMMNPEHIIPVIDELVDSFNSNKIFKFVHIPVQSGNNRVLSVMKRRYTVGDFKEIVKAFRKKFPKITISTDIICGFPTETEEEFNDTLNLIKEVKPAVLNISRYWSRPLTEASRLKQVPGGEIKRRSKALTELFDKISLEENEKWVGWKGKTIIDEVGRVIIGRNFAYKPIILKSGELGQVVDVEIKKAKTHNLLA